MQGVRWFHLFFGLNLENMQRLVFALGRQVRACASVGRVYTPRLAAPACLFSTCAGKDSQCGKACGQMCGDCHSRIE